MKISTLLLLTALCASAAPADLDPLIAAARSAPGEFAADALIRLASVDKLEKARKIELLDQAFQKAPSAQFPYKRHAAPMRQDGTVGYWNRVYNQDLDALSLRLRVVEAMLPLDSRKARELFLQIPAPKPPRLTCEEFLVYDVGHFYDVLARILKEGFSPKEVQDREPFKLLQRYAGVLASPVQVGPMARVLSSATLKDADFQTLETEFAAALGKVSGDDRSFVYSITLPKDIQGLTEEAKKRKLSPLPLLEAYRLYLVINLSAARCADDDLMAGGRQSFGVFSSQPVEQQASDFVSFFNDKLRVAPLQPIQEEEATPSHLKGVATGLRTCQDTECRNIATQYRSLVYGPTEKPYLPAERETAEWQGKLHAMLGALSDWKDSSGSTAAEFFREKSAAYGELVNLAPNSSRELVLNAILDFVKGNRFKSTDPVEWFLPVNGLIGRTGLDPNGLAKFSETLHKVNDPVIAMYAGVESVAPRPADRILPLL